jgi:hypothetical protein
MISYRSHGFVALTYDYLALFIMYNIIIKCVNVLFYVHNISQLIAASNALRALLTWIRNESHLSRFCRTNPSRGNVWMVYVKQNIEKEKEKNENQYTELGPVVPKEVS